MEKSYAVMMRKSGHLDNAEELVIVIATILSWDIREGDAVYRLLMALGTVVSHMD